MLIKEVTCYNLIILQVALEKEVHKQVNKHNWGGGNAAVLTTGTSLTAWSENDQ